MTDTNPTPTASVLLEAKHIVKVFGSGADEVRPLKGVDLKLYAGELTLLMGPSGSGKTTLLSILGCILSPTEGYARGRRQLDRRARRRRPRQHPAPARRLRVPGLQPVPDDDGERERHAGAGRARHARRRSADARAQGADRGRASPIAPRLSRPSSAAARSSASRSPVRWPGSPSVILADEPTAALDAENGRAVMALLAEVAKDPNRAVLAVTHDHRTLPYADRIVRIEDGKIHSDERPKKSANPTYGADPHHDAHASHRRAGEPLSHGQSGRRQPHNSPDLDRWPL